MPQHHSILRSEVQKQRAELASKLPALGARVFDLNGHYSLARTLGALLQKLNDYDVRFTAEDLVLCEVLYEELLERLQASGV